MLSLFCDWHPVPLRPVLGEVTPSTAFPRNQQVKPYHFDFSCSVKQRWGGQTLLDVFSKVRLC